MSDLKVFEDDFALLTEAGFVAVSHMEEDAANKLFHAAQVLDPEHTLPQIGLAAVALHRLDLRTSSEILQTVIEKEPDNLRAKALLGISYILSNKDVSLGEQYLKEAMEQGDDPATQRLAELWLKVLEIDVRKATNPLQPQQREEAKPVND